MGVSTLLHAGNTSVQVPFRKCTKTEISESKQNENSSCDPDFKENREEMCTNWLRLSWWNDLDTYLNNFRENTSIFFECLSKFHAPDPCLCAS